MQHTVHPQCTCKLSTVPGLVLLSHAAALCPPARPVHALQQEGWRAFYRGMVPSMLGILPYAGVDITIFELLKERLLDQVSRRLESLCHLLRFCLVPCC